MSRQGRKRLGIDLPEVVHKAVHKRAHENYTTVTKFVTRVLIEYLKRTEGFDPSLKKDSDDD